jgi:hypothetical protein
MATLSIGQWPYVLFAVGGVFTAISQVTLNTPYPNPTIFWIFIETTLGLAFLVAGLVLLASSREPGREAESRPLV